MLRMAVAVALPLLLHTLRLGAQAPIERRQPPPLPAAPPQAPDRAEEHEWQHLERMAYDGSAAELRIQALGPYLRCTLDAVTPDELDCTQYRPLPTPAQHFFFPPELYRVPRSDIREVRSGGRDLSTLTLALAGFGMGAGLGAQQREEPQAYALIDGILLGALGAFVGHLAPFKGHVIYHRR